MDQYAIGVNVLLMSQTFIGLNVTAIVKDGDSNLLSAVNEYFPGVLAIQDVNHFIKNIPKVLQTP